MVKIKFKDSPHFQKLLLIKYLFQTLHLSLQEGKEAVESGVIKCPDQECNNAIKKIVEYGGTQIEVEEMKPLPDDTANTQSEKKNVTAIRIVPSGYEEGLAIQSEIPVEKHVFQTLNDNPSMWQFVIDKMPFICRLTQQRIQLQNGEEEYRSLLAARTSENRNTIEEITSLSKVVRDVHAEIISTILKFHNLAEKFKPFIDDVGMETRLDNSY